MDEIIIIALEAEAPELAKRDNVFFSGVGKVNAALCAAELIAKYNPKTVWNFGTAGGITLKSGLHEMKNFVERDRQGCPASLGIIVQPEEKLISFGEGYTCSTGDDFVMDPNLEIPADVVEMEAFAIAKACHRAGVDFRCFKYVSDSADGDSVDDWISNVANGEPHYIKVLDNK